MSDLVVYHDNTTGLDYAGDIGETTPVGWQPHYDLAFDEWLSIGNTLMQINASCNWWIGDWLNYGEHKWGEMYAQLEAKGYEYQTLANAKWVTGRVQFSLRRENLTWSHHKEVASLEPEEQAAWLNRAEAEGWSVRRLREEIKGLQVPPPSLSLSEPDEAPFNHKARWGIPAEERTAVDEYEQQPDSIELNHCDVCGKDWMADLPYCPYCNLSATARIEYAQRPETFYPLTAANHAVSDDPNYDGDEWYTPQEYIEAARDVMGQIDLDPASCEAANAIVQAATYHSKEDDALRPDLKWHGRVWLNPPYSTPLIQRFVAKLIDQYESGNVTEAIILTNNSSDTAWFHDLLSRYPACFTRGRARFWRPDSANFGARQGQTLFYLGDDVDTFRFVFAQVGQVVRTL